MLRSSNCRFDFVANKVLSKNFAQCEMNDVSEVVTMNAVTVLCCFFMVRSFFMMLVHNVMMIVYYIIMILHNVMMVLHYVTMMHGHYSN